MLLTLFDKPKYMPRLNHSMYSAQHDVLYELWERTNGFAFTVLSTNEQWDLHDFFAVTHQLADPDLREHRRLVTELDPSLPHRAGRALKKLNEGLAVRAAEQEARQTATVAAPATGRRKYRRNADRKIRVESVAHPQPDPHKFALALIELAKEMRAKEQEQQAKREDAA